MRSIETIRSLKFFIGGYGATNYEIIIDGAILYYRAYDYGFEDPDKIEVHLSNVKIQTLIDQLNTIEVCKWKKEYISDAHDGTQWELKIAYNRNKHLKVYGSNSYPKKGNSSLDVSKEFSILLESLFELAGQKDFREFIF